MASRTADTERDRRDGHRRYDADRSANGFARAARIAGAVLGGVLLFRGLKRRSLRGIVTAIAGGVVLFGAVRAGRSRGDSQDRSTGPADTGSPGQAEVPTVSRSITIGKPADELYEAWRDPDVFSRVMGHVAEVEPRGQGRYEWTVEGAPGRLVSWETRVVEEEPGEYVRWRTPDDATVRSEWSVRFRPAPGDRGTEVTLRIEFDPPGGRLARAAFDRLEIVPEALAGRALDRFKSLVETGVVPTKEGNPSGRGRGDLL